MNRSVAIGFVGVGRMGANMARRLVDQGYHLAGVHDLDSQKAKELADELRCEICESPAKVTANSQVIFTVVSDDESMDTIFADDNPSSLLNGATGRLFVNCATVSPFVHQNVERLAQQHGADSLEACMASSITQARNGTLYFMCGGHPEVFEKAKPLLNSLGQTIRYIGTAGQAAQVKAMVNMVMNANTAALAEGLGLGNALGFDLNMLREVFSQTGAASRVQETDGEDMQIRDHDCYYSVDHAVKDLGIALAMAKEQQLHIPLVQSAFEQYQELVRVGKGHLDKSGISELTFQDRGNV